jgi:hypothetical protein
LDGRGFDQWSQIDSFLIYGQWKRKTKALPKGRYLKDVWDYYDAWLAWSQKPKEAV